MTVRLSTFEQAADFRLGSAGLAPGAVRRPTPAEVVGWFGAMQSQDHAPALWSIGQRMSGEPTAASLQDAFDRGEFIRAHVLRTTWHFVRPEDLGWLLMLTSDRVHQLCGTGYRQFGLDRELRDRAAKILAEALRGGKAATRPELASVLAGKGIEAEKIPLSLIFMSAELDGLICSGPKLGKQHSYMLIEDRIHASRELTRDEALVELLVTYLRSHGPATAKDFQWWSSLTLAEIKRAIAIAGKDIESDVIDGYTFFSLTGAAAGATSGVRRTGREIRLLQAFDEYTVAFSPRPRLADLEARMSQASRRPGSFNSIALQGSQVAGSWKRTVNSASVTIEIEPVVEFNDSDRASLADAASELGRFLEREPIVREIGGAIDASRR